MTSRTPWFVPTDSDCVWRTSLPQTSKSACGWIVEIVGARPTNRTDDGDASELIQELTPAVVDAGGKRYVARVFGERDDIGRWRGWLEFKGDGKVFRTEPETVQTSRAGLAYWASGLEPIYLEGAFERAARISGRAASVPLRLARETAARVIRTRPV